MLQSYQYRDLYESLEDETNNTPIASSDFPVLIELRRRVAEWTLRAERAERLAYEAKREKR